MTVFTSRTSLFITLFLISTISNAKAHKWEDPNNFANQLTKIIQGEKKSELSSLFITKDELLKVLEKSNESEEKKAKVQKEIDDFFPELIADFEKGNIDLWLEIRKAGIEPKNLTLVEIEFDIEQEENIVSGDFKIWVSDGNTKYRLKARKCIYTGKRWVLMRSLNFRNPSEEHYWEEATEAATEEEVVDEAAEEAEAEAEEYAEEEITADEEMAEEAAEEATETILEEEITE